jgi:hypothetical protein
LTCFHRGDRVELVHCNDQFTKLRVGSKGTFVEHTNPRDPDFDALSVAWDDGSSLLMVPGVGDRIRKAVD